MSRHVTNWVIAGICALFLLTSSVLPQEEAAPPDAKQQAISKLAQEVRKQIVTQPQYGVFDSIHFAIVIELAQEQQPTRGRLGQSYMPSAYTRLYPSLAMLFPCLASVSVLTLVRTAIYVVCQRVEQSAA